MHDVTPIRYGRAAYQAVSCRPVAIHVQAAKTQTWRYLETGKLANKTYRITIEHDGSYPHQSRAVLDVLHADWVPVARFFGPEVNDLMDTHHYQPDEAQRKATASAAFDIVATALKREAAELLFGDDATDRL